MLSPRGVANSGGTAGPPGGTLRTYTIHVGNGPAGDVAADFDFLDPGDGSGIDLALAAAAGVGGNVDIKLMRGQYDLRGVGSPAARFVAPQNTTITGAGRGTQIVGRAVGDTRIVSLASGAVWENMLLTVPKPTGASTGAGGLVSLSGQWAIARSLYVEFAGGAYNPAEALNLTAALHSVFDVDSLEAFGETQIVDCNIGSWNPGTGNSEATAPACAPLGATDFDLVRARSAAFPFARLIGGRMEGGDKGINADSFMLVDRSYIVSERVAAFYDVNSGSSEVSRSYFQATGFTPGKYGMYVAAPDLRITGNSINGAGVAASYGISLLAGADNCNIADNRISTWGTGLQIASNTNIATSNRFTLSAVPWVDLIGTSVVANNL